MDLTSQNITQVTKMQQILLFLTIISLTYSFSPKNVKIDNIKYVEISEKYHLRNETLDPSNEIFTRAAKIEAVMNDYGDSLFLQFRNLLNNEGYNPLEMPEVYESFSYDLIIVYHGELILVNGWLSDLSTIHRGGDVKIAYSPSLKYLVATIPVGFTNLEFNYDYSAHIMGMGPSGYIQGSLKSLAFEMRVTFDVNSFELDLVQLKITRVGNIGISFYGEPLIDWLLDLLTYVVSGPMEDLVTLVAEEVLREVIESKIDIINNVIGDFINPKLV